MDDSNPTLPPEILKGFAAAGIAAKVQHKQSTHEVLVTIETGTQKMCTSSSKCDSRASQIQIVCRSFTLHHNTDQSTFFVE